MSAIMVM